MPLKNRPDNQIYTMRQCLRFDPGWRFHLGEPDAQSAFLDQPSTVNTLPYKEGPAAPGFDDSAWRLVDLPHDWVVEGSINHSDSPSHGFLPTGTAWYRKNFALPESDRGKRIYLHFDGIYRDSKVWINGFFMGRHRSGYTGFYYDIRDFLNYGAENTVAVHVDATSNEGWFYEGGGIYRHAWLVKTAPVHIAPWGLFAEPKPLEGLDFWEVVAHTEIINACDRPSSCIVECALFDPLGRPVVTESSIETLRSGERLEVSQKLLVNHPRLWSVDSPHLYRLVTTLHDETGDVDSCDTTLGFRTLRFDPEHGFFLNDHHLKLHGTCNHQDHAGVGSALPDYLHEWRIARLKEMGCNAYRCAHNPPAPELLDACDRLGMLVIDEARHLSSTPEGLADLEDMLRRDRNHPAIILWSMGNEEPIQGSETGGLVLASMMRTVRRLDPTRPVIQAMNGGYGSLTSQLLDVQGFNYHIGEYGSFHAQQPDRPVVVTESGSTVSTRGIYANDPERGYVSAYDLNHPAWSNTAEESWAAAAIRSFIAGTFVWTGFDYRGEPTPYEWPCVNSHFGIMDVCGFPKDNFYYYQARWSKQPVLHLLPHWNWPGKEGQIISVWCHTNCERVELFLNGASLGVKVLPRYGHLEWQVPYAPGLLVAKGFQGDRLVTTAERRTTGAPARLALATEKAALRADGEDTAVVRVAVQDMDGLVVPTASSLVRFNLRGPARILGVGNGDPSCHEPDKASQRSVFGGLCQVILQASHESGEIVLEAESEGLEPARLAFLMQNAFTHRQKQPGEQPAGHQAPQGNLDPGG